MQNPSLPCSELLHAVADQLSSFRVGGKGCILWYQSFASISKCLRIHQSRWSCRSTCYPFSSVSVLDGAGCSIHSYCSVLRAWAPRAKQSSSSAHRVILQSIFTIFLLLQTDFCVEGREWQVPQNTPHLMALCWLCFWSCGGSYVWTSEAHKLLLWENVREVLVSCEKMWRRETELPQTSKLDMFLVLESQAVGIRVVKCEEGGD